MPKHEITSTIGYSFGDTTIKVSVAGPIDRPDVIMDHMMTAATETLGVNFIQHALCEGQAGTETAQDCTHSTEFGEIALRLEIGITSKYHISNRTLNTIVIGSVLPTVWKAAALYLGDHLWQTKPQAPLTARRHDELQSSMEDTLGLTGPMRIPPSRELTEYATTHPSA